jgi:hypothetical protein
MIFLNSNSKVKRDQLIHKKIKKDLKSISKKGSNMKSFEKTLLIVATLFSVSFTINSCRYDMLHSDLVALDEKLDDIRDRVGGSGNSFQKKSSLIPKDWEQKVSEIQNKMIDFCSMNSDYTEKEKAVKMAKELETEMKSISEYFEKTKGDSSSESSEVEDSPSESKTESEPVSKPESVVKKEEPKSDEIPEDVKEPEDGTPEEPEEPGDSDDTPPDIPDEPPM